MQSYTRTTSCAFGRTTTTATLALIVSSAPAFAVEPNEFVAAIQAASSESGYELSVKDATKVGDGILLSGITYSLPTTSAAALQTPAFVLGDLLFEGVRETDEGIAFDGASATEIDVLLETNGPGDATRLRIAEWGLGEGIVPAYVRSELMQTLTPYGLLYKRVYLDDLSLDGPLGQSLRLDRAEGTFDYEAEPFTFSATVGKATVNIPEIAAAGEPEFYAWLKENDYLELALSARLDGSYDQASGRMAIENYEYDIERMGSLKMRFVVEGYTPELVARFSEAEASTNRPQTTSELEALLEGLVISEARVRFEDDGITDPLLDLAAKEAGTDRASIIAIAAGGAPIAAGVIGVPGIGGELYAAVDAFLRDPKSFTISIGNDGPIPIVPLLGLLDGADPAPVLSGLGIAVSAND